MHYNTVYCQAPEPPLSFHPGNSTHSVSQEEESGRADTRVPGSRWSVWKLKEPETLVPKREGEG